jgi:hypothetical protein
MANTTLALQNRVDPFGDIHAVPERGTCMGNRGILHDDQQQLQRYHDHKRWTICKLAYQDQHGNSVKRSLMSPGQYTELFFLDEATALAAGHRPCGRCSRSRYQEFLHYWRMGNPDAAGRLDDVLHHDRFVPYKRVWRAKKRVYTAPIDGLPSGTFIMLDPDPSGQLYMIQEHRLLRWSFGGYGPPVEGRSGVDVIVITPQSTVRALAAGYQPVIYPAIY